MNVASTRACQLVKIATDTKKHTNTWINKNVTNKVNKQVKNKEKGNTEIRKAWRKERMEEKKFKVTKSRR
jgi:3-methyladenine DNA glycosylase AlkC